MSAPDPQQLAEKIATAIIVKLDIDQGVYSDWRWRTEQVLSTLDRLGFSIIPTPSTPPTHPRGHDHVEGQLYCNVPGCPDLEDYFP